MILNSGGDDLENIDAPNTKRKTRVAVKLLRTYFTSKTNSADLENLQFES